MVLLLCSCALSEAYWDPEDNTVEVLWPLPLPYITAEQYALKETPEKLFVVFLHNHVRASRRFNAIFATLARIVKLVDNSYGLAAVDCADPQNLDFCYEATRGHTPRMMLHYSGAAIDIYSEQFTGYGRPQETILERSLLVDRPDLAIQAVVRVAESVPGREGQCYRVEVSPGVEARYLVVMKVYSHYILRKLAFVNRLKNTLPICVEQMDPALLESRDEDLEEDEIEDDRVVLEMEAVTLNYTDGSARVLGKQSLTFAETKLPYARGLVERFIDMYMPLEERGAYRDQYDAMLEELRGMIYVAEHSTCGSAEAELEDAQ